MILVPKKHIARYAVTQPSGTQGALCIHVTICAKSAAHHAIEATVRPEPQRKKSCNGHGNVPTVRDPLA